MKDYKWILLDGNKKIDRNLNISVRKPDQLDLKDDELGVLINYGVENKIVGVKNIDKKHHAYLVEKETILEKNKNRIVDYRYINEEYIIFSSIKEKVVKSLLQEGKIKAMTTVLDQVFRLKSINFQENILIFILGQDELEVLIWTEDRVFVDRKKLLLDLDEWDQIEGYIEDKIDVDSFHRIYFLDITLRQSNRQNIIEIDLKDVF